MTQILKDPLLVIARVLLTLFLVLFGIALIACVIVLIALPFTFAQAQIVELGLADGVSSWSFAGRLLIGLLLAGITLVCAFLFTLLLRRIIDTVSAGDPFSPINAGRLQYMGYLILVLWVNALLLPLVAAWVNALLQRSDRLEVYHISADGLLLALVLFILARVFRHGTDMREELEGTI